MAESLISISYDDTEEEDYIDIEVSSYHGLFSHSKPREFEFQMFARSPQKETTTSPADELFYKGKLLPLHLPPRLQMVEKLLQDKTYDEFFSTPLATNAHTTPTMNTPFQSCNISPSDSCQVSRELDPEEYFLEGLTKTNEFIGEIPKRSWRRKLKASRDYLKSLFIKSSYTNEAPASGLENGAFQKAKESAKNTTFGQIKEAVKMRRTTAGKKFVKASGGGNHRRSFSGAIKRFSTSSSSLFPSGSSSSSSSSNSNNFHELQLYHGSNNRCSESENPIQSAIAHCKRSQQQLHSRKTISDMGFCSLAASRIIYEDQERQVLCRG